MTNKQNPLDAVYTEGAVTDAAELYDNWAEEYEADLRAVGYAAAGRCASALASADPMLSSPILDLGCGTGLSGEALQGVGFKEIDGYDFSEGMLALARKKDCYRELFRVDLAQPDSIPDRGYRDAVLAGVLHHTHAPPETLAQTLARLPQEGCIVFSLNDETLRFPEYTDYISHLVESGQVAVVSEEYGPHLPGRDVGARVYVLRKFRKDLL